jgi:BolA family transcriptional regulator, general stress-responsive regulator
MSLQASMAQRIREKLYAAFAPLSLEVIDDSRKHLGHTQLMRDSGKAAPSGETHFTVKMVSEAFKDKSRIDRHRMVNAALRAEIAAGVHALAIEAKAPGE